MCLFGSVEVALPKFSLILLPFPGEKMGWKLKPWRNMVKSACRDRDTLEIGQESQPVDIANVYKHLNSLICKCFNHPKSKGIAGFCANVS